MAYSDLDDLKNQLPESKIIQLTDDEGIGTIHEERAYGCRKQGDDLIDSYCGQVADVPFISIPDIINSHSITLWIYYLYKRRTSVPEMVRKDYEDVIAHLKDIAAGRASIGPITAADYEDNIKTDRTSDDRTITMGKKSDGSSGTLDNY